MAGSNRGLSARLGSLGENQCAAPEASHTEDGVSNIFVPEDLIPTHWVYTTEIWFLHVYFYVVIPNGLLLPRIQSKHFMD